MAVNAGSRAPLASLVYQSRATVPLSEAELQRLVASAQSRNRKEGVTGLLVYDQGRFLQWLEGPAEGLARVWQAIRLDPRHEAIALLGESTTPVRLFGGSPMALGKRRGERGAEDRSALAVPVELIETLRKSAQAAQGHAPSQRAEAEARADGPTAADRLWLQALVDRVLGPKRLPRRIPSVLSPYFIDPRSTELARLLVTGEPRAAFALIDALRADGRSIAQLCPGLFEPAARALGDMWRADDCTDVEVTLGLGHLQAALRRVSIETSSADVPRLPLAVPHAVLVAPSPHEPHVLGSAIASEMFWRAGWDVRCEFPGSDAALNRLVHDQWFDVLDLSLSGAFRREHRLPAMAESIRAAHAHSLNPALTVIVDGRVFHERPQASAEVGAAASSASAQGLVPMARYRSQLGKRVPAHWG